MSSHSATNEYAKNAVQYCIGVLVGYKNVNNIGNIT